MFYPLANTTWDAAEYDVLQDVIKSDRFTMGPRVRAFEEAFAAKFGKRYAVMTSSGSTANLLAVTATFHHPDMNFAPGDEVIVPAVSWSTTYFPVTQNGLSLRFVDIDAATLNIDVDAVAAAITPRTRMVLAVNLLGNPVEAARLRKICADAGIILAEDNCESMGASLNGEMAGAFGLWGTFSTFFSHHICTMEGGLVITDDRKLYDNMLSIRAHGWVRDLPEDTHLPMDPDPFVRQFRFVLPGYNLRPLEMSGAIGQEQIAKLPMIVKERRDNAAIFREVMAEFPALTIQKEIGESSWFGFSMVLDEAAGIDRKALVDRLVANGIECRPIVAGNFAKNEVVKKYMPHDIHGILTNAEHIDRNGLFIGNHHYALDQQFHFLTKALKEAL